MDIAADRLERLRRATQEATGTVWNPYSNYTVIAAVETVDGRYYGGGNVENANYSLTKHAEEAAVLAAINDGALERCGRRFISAVYVFSKKAPAPCGSCRQFILEFAAEDAAWVGEDEEGLASGRFVDLLPYGFTPEKLGVED